MLLSSSNYSALRRPAALPLGVCDREGIRPRHCFKILVLPDRSCPLLCSWGPGPIPSVCLSRTAWLVGPGIFSSSPSDALSVAPVPRSPRRCAQDNAATISCGLIIAAFVPRSRLSTSSEPPVLSAWRFMVHNATAPVWLAAGALNSKPDAPDSDSYPLVSDVNRAANGTSQQPDPLSERQA